MESKERNSFIFYRSFRECTEGLPYDVKGILYDAIADYALEAKEPQLTGVAKSLFVLIRPQLEANWKRYLNGCKGADDGVKGGGQIGNQNAVKKKRPQNDPQTTPNDNVNDNVNVNPNPNCNANVESKTKSGNRFSPPTLEEIKSYIEEKGYSVDAERFFNYYESNGWSVGRNKMKNWRAAVANWERTDKDRPTPAPAVPDKYESRRSDADFAAKSSKDYKTTF